MNDHGQAYDYPASVALQIKDDTIEDYVRLPPSSRTPAGST